MIDWMQSSRGTAAIFALFLLTTLSLLGPIALKILRRRHKALSGAIQVLHDPANAQFEIVAVHGLGADSEYTWTQAVPVFPSDRKQDLKATSPDPGHFAGRTHLLRDLLPRAFPQARILSFAHNSNWLINAPVKTTEEIGKNLLDQVKAKKSQQNLPIIFIGHSLGGIIIKHALCIDGSQGIINDTSGIIFLGTPHQGSSVSVTAAVLAFVTGFLGSNTTALLSLKRDEPQLSDLGDRFGKCIAEKKRRRQKIEIISFYETMPTYLLGFLSIGLVVSRNSAVVQGYESKSIDTDHSGLNKCTRLDDGLLIELKKAIYSLRAPSRLEEGDARIQSYYIEKRLSVERLSGDLLPLDECYINLSIVEQPGEMANHSKKGSKEADPAARLSPFLVDARQKYRTSGKAIQVELDKIFNERTQPKRKPLRPRRILIRGNAGVGKTTMCKKIVHDFMKRNMWQPLFKRVLWIPLRNLKGRDPVGYNLSKLFYDEYFCQYLDGKELAHELWQELNDTKSERTLFVLDGLDEISQLLDSKVDIVTQLLNQPNVIITSRPYAAFPASRVLDLELQTVGFNPHQVKDYIEKAFIVPETGESDWRTTDKIKSFLRDNWVLQDLIKIPIMLEALCYTWEDLDDGPIPDTMTSIYRAIVQKLWKKDAQRLEKPVAVHKQRAYPAEIQRSVNPENTMLECLAFNGLYSDVIDFTNEHRGIIVENFNLDLPLDETLRRLSFLRTSDTSAETKVQNCHFLHLSFQEFFAAQYFVRQWKARGKLEYVFKMTSDQLTNPVEFLQGHKYTARYDIFWRFVAGLLDATEDAADFFNSIETEPLDMLGPTHQRLVMHCLSQVLSDFPSKKTIESRISDWILFEKEFNGSSFLAEDVECPKHVLASSLRKASMNLQKQIVLSLIRRSTNSRVAIEHLTRLLEDEDWRFRLQAIKAITRKSYWPQKLFETVVAGLGDENWAVREAAVEAVRGQSDWPKNVLEAVAARLGDESSATQEAAIQALRGQSDWPERVFEAVAARLEDEHSNVQKAAIQALTGPSNWPENVFEAVVARLGDEHWSVREAAVKALIGQSDWPQKVFEAMAARLDDKYLHIRKAAVQALIGRSNWPEKVFEAVVARLGDKNWAVRKTTVQTIIGQSDWPEKGFEAVVARLGDEHWSVREAAVQALIGQSEWPERALEAVAARLRDEYWAAREAAVQALRGQSDWPKNVHEAVVARLDDEHWAVRKAAIRALRGQSDCPANVDEAIAARLKEGHSNVREAAVQALRGQSNWPANVVEAVAVRVEDEYWAVRKTAIQALGGQSDWPQKVVEAVVARLEDEYWAVREAAVQALSGQSDWPKVFEAVAARLEDKLGAVREAAVQALRGQSNWSEKVFEAVAERLEDEHSDVRKAAVQALIGQSNWPANVVEAVAARVEDEYWAVREAAVQALRGQSDWPEKGFEVMAARLEDERWDVREAAAQALREQSDWPANVIEAVATKLVDELAAVRMSAFRALRGKSDWPENVLEAVAAQLGDEHRYIRRYAEDLLRRHEKFYCALFNSRYWTNLYNVLMELSFEEQVSFYIKDGNYYLELADSMKVMLVPNQKNVRDMIDRV